MQNQILFTAANFFYYFNQYCIKANASNANDPNAIMPLFANEIILLQTADGDFKEFYLLLRDNCIKAECQTIEDFMQELENISSQLFG